MHVLRDDEARTDLAGAFLGQQEFRDDAVDVAAIGAHGLGHGAHHADVAAAIDQPDAVLGHDLAEVGGGLDEGRVGARARAAIDADFFDFAHFLDSLFALHVQRNTGVVKAWKSIAAAPE